MNRLHRHSQLALGLLILLAFAVRAITLDSQSLWRDEVDALRFARLPWAEMRANFVTAGFNGPLYHVLLRGWLALPGASEYSLRFFSLWFGVMGVALAFVLGARLYGRGVGVITALLVTTSPYLVWYSQEGKMYTLVVALALLAIYALRRAVDGGGWPWWIIQVVATTFAFYSHILAALLIPLQVVLALLWWPQTRKHWVAGLISLACLVVPYLPLLAWQAPLVFRSRTTGFYPYTMGEMARILLLAWVQGVQPVQGTLSTLLRTAMGGLAVWSLWFAVLRPAARKTGACAEVQPPVAETTSAAWQAVSALAPLIWILLPYLAVGIVSIWQPLFTDRYLIWSAPAFYMLIAAGLVLFARSGIWGAGFAGILLALILAGNGLHVWRQATVPAKSDLRSAAAYVVDYGKARLNMAVETYAHHQYLPLAQTEGSGHTLIVFQIPHARYAFEYYAPGNGYEWANGAFTNHRDRSGAYLVTAEQNAADMATTTAGYDVVWLVLTEWESWDERGLVQAWLEANAQRVDEAHFLRVDVYRYLLSSAP